MLLCCLAVILVLFVIYLMISGNTLKEGLTPDPASTHPLPPEADGSPPGGWAGQWTSPNCNDGGAMHATITVDSGGKTGMAKNAAAEEGAPQQWGGAFESGTPLYFDGNKVYQQFPKGKVLCAFPSVGPTGDTKAMFGTDLKNISGAGCPIGACGYCGSGSGTGSNLLTGLYGSCEETKKLFIPYTPPGGQQKAGSTLTGICNPGYSATGDEHAGASWVLPNDNYGGEGSFWTYEYTRRGCKVNPIPSCIAEAKNTPAMGTPNEASEGCITYSNPGCNKLKVGTGAITWDDGCQWQKTSNLMYTCKDFDQTKCLAGNHLAPSYTPCKEKGGTVAECCIPNPLCSTALELVSNPEGGEMNAPMTCPAGYTKKKNFDKIHCTDSDCFNPGFTKECCDPPPLLPCSTFIKQNCLSPPWKPNPAATKKTYKYGTGHATCCLPISTANPTCDTLSACPTGQQFKSGYKSISCAGDPCKDAECCDPIPQTTCSAFTCPTNSTLRANSANINCAATTCTDAECCSKNPPPPPPPPPACPADTCAGFTGCSPGTHLGLPTTQCSPTCTAADCCISNPTCSSISACPTGRQFKSNYKKIPCKGATCLDTECCDPIPQPTCSAFTCPTHSTLRANSKDINCVGAACTDDECCSKNPLPTCESNKFKCPAHHHLTKNYDTTQCKDYLCTNADCCSLNPTCRTLQCNAGFYPKGSSKVCKGAKCTNKECCRPNPQCDTFMCDSGFTPKPDAATITCSATTCNNTECCNLITPLPCEGEESNINVYYPGMTFITFDEREKERQRQDKKNSVNSDIYQYSEYDSWSTPQQSINYRTSNMFGALNNVNPFATTSPPSLPTQFGPVPLPTAPYDMP